MRGFLRNLVAAVAMQMTYRQSFVPARSAFQPVQLVISVCNDEWAPVPPNINARSENRSSGGNLRLQVSRTDRQHQQQRKVLPLYKYSAMHNTSSVAWTHWWAGNSVGDLYNFVEIYDSLNECAHHRNALMVAIGCR